MQPLELVVKTGIYVLMGITVFAAASAVSLKNLFHAGLSLAAVLIGVAGIYLAVGAEFLAMVQVLIYVGAVMTLIIYAIMLTGRLNASGLRQTNRQVWPALIAGIIFVVLVGRFLLRFPWQEVATRPTDAFSLKRLGIELMSTYVFPFEVVGVLLFAVLIGAIVIARKDTDG